MSNINIRSLPLTENCMQSEGEMRFCISFILYTKYFLKDITPENICSKNLNFGNYLRLENGNFILKGTIGKSGIIPAERIIAHSPGLAGLIALKGYDSNGKMKDLMPIHPKQTGNMEALYYIIDKIIPNIPKI